MSAPDFTALDPFEQEILRDAGVVEDRVLSIAETLHRARIVADEKGLPWERWFNERVKPALNLRIGERRARQLIGYAKADNPAEAIEADRKTARERMAAGRTSSARLTEEHKRLSREAAPKHREEITPEATESLAFVPQSAPKEIGPEDISFALLRRRCTTLTDPEARTLLPVIVGRIDKPADLLDSLNGPAPVAPVPEDPPHLPVTVEVANPSRPTSSPPVSAEPRVPAEADSDVSLLNSGASVVGAPVLSESEDELLILPDWARRT